MSEVITFLLGFALGTFIGEAIGWKNMKRHLEKDGWKRSEDF